MTICSERLGVEAIHGWMPAMLDTGATPLHDPTVLRLF